MPCCWDWRWPPTKWRNCKWSSGESRTIWKYLDSSLSPAQNIDEILFAGSDKLENEFNELYASQFKKEEAYMRIFFALGTRKSGMSRGEITSAARGANYGMLTKHLRELEQCGFIRKYTIPDRKSKGSIFQLMDNFTLFHLKFLADLFRET